jgi:outer membrane receptor protein involved in Fe transport
MPITRSQFLGIVLGALALCGARPAAPAPSLEYAFTVKATLLPPVEQGEVDGGRKRFIAITGGTVDGPLLMGTVMAGGGDWQTILPGGLTRVEARYFLKAADGTVIEVTNPGVRTGTPEVIARLSKGEDVDPAAYYFRTTPSFAVTAGPHEWLRRHAFVARGIRRPDHVEIDFYVVR